MAGNFLSGKFQGKGEAELIWRFLTGWRRDMAGHVGITHQRVSQIATSFKYLNDVQSERNVIEVTRNGQTYTQNTTNIGRRPVSSFTPPAHGLDFLD